MHRSPTPYLLLLGIVTASLGVAVEPLLVKTVATMTTDPEGDVLAQNLVSLARLCSYLSVAVFFLAGFFSKTLNKQRGSWWLLGTGVLLSMAAICAYVYGMSIIDGGMERKIVEGSLYAICALALAFAGGLFIGSPSEVRNCPPNSANS